MMDKTQASSDAPGRLGLARDFTRLKRDGSASAAELREFVKELRGRSPQEVLGLVAQSSLMHGVAVSTLLCLALMAAFTAGPYAWNKSSPPPKKAAAVAAPAVNAASEEPPSEAKSPGKPGSGEKPLIDPKVAKQLGVDEVKQSDPGSNPLESKDDDLLKIK